MKSLEKLKERLKTVKNIVITTHVNPDGDAIGSSLALKHFFDNKGYNATVIIPNGQPEYLRWLPGNKELIVFQYTKHKAVKLLESADMIFSLDYNDLKRVNEIGEIIEQQKAIKVLIDHHPHPGDFDDYRLWDENASSTAELIFDFIQFIDPDGMNQQVAECIYTGIMTDTGGFQFPNTTAKVHRTVASLLETGVNNYKVYDNVFNHFSEKRLRFFGHSIINRMQVFPEYKAALIYITKEDQEKYSIKRGDTEGLVNFPLQIKGIRFSTLFIERDEFIKISLRSKGNFDVNEFARTHYNGGGHINASGGTSNHSMDNTLKQFTEVLPLYEEQLNQTPIL